MSEQYWPALPKEHKTGSKIIQGDLFHMTQQR